mmetsp:Transcript_60297/g.143672  ORF Transcript_60297/g.143672 Transcript_60297/m.143672 type:complete len:430 (+) Transcript_60297:172-1461(+)
MLRRLQQLRAQGHNRKRVMAATSTASGPATSANEGSASKNRGKSLAEFEEEIGRLQSLLDAFKRTDGKDKLVEEIIRDAPKFEDERNMGHLALIHGPEEMANKMLSALGDFGINAALLLSVTLNFAFDPPDAVMDYKDDWLRHAFLILIYLSVFSHFSTVILMMYLSTGLNLWAREADVLAMLWRSGKNCADMLMISFIIGFATALSAAILAVRAGTDEPKYGLLGLGFILIWLWGITHGVTLYAGTVDDSRFLRFSGGLLPKPPSCENTEYGAFVQTGKTIKKKYVAAGKDPADFFDVPFDVLRKQAELGKLLDDDTWRQGELGMMREGSKRGVSSTAPPAPAVEEDNAAVPCEGAAQRPPAPSLSMKEVLNQVEAGFGELYADKLVAECIEVPQLPQLSCSLLKQVGLPLGHALKVEQYFGKPRTWL